MNYAVIRYILGSVLCVEGIFLLVPALVAGIYQESVGYIYLILAIAAFFAGELIRFRKPKSKVFYSKEGFAAVVFSWILLSFVGALPMYISGEYQSYIDALFDTISGFTTTGAGVLSSVEQLTRGTAFWRCFTHWSGGMGVLVFIMAVLPLSGSSNMHLMRAESPGPSVGKLVPKVRQTAMILYGIYIVITIIQIVALLLTGLSLYDAAALSFSTVGTGGFALLDSSISAYSIPVQVIIIIFMLVCAINFNVWYYLVRKLKDAVLHFREEIKLKRTSKNTRSEKERSTGRQKISLREKLTQIKRAQQPFEEAWVFLLLVFSAAILITFNIRKSYHNIFYAFHTALFQVATLISSTGFATADYDQWPQFSKMILLLAMFVGACAGSTGGGFKVSRLMLIVRAAKNELMSMIHPRSVHNVQMGGHRVQNSVVRTALCYLGVYVFILLLSILLISLDNFDLTTNLTAVLATMNNIGPGLNMVGPTGNYGSFSNFSKIILMIDMLVGRLEIFPVLVLFSADMWKLPVVTVRSRAAHLLRGEGKAERM